MKKQSVEKMAEKDNSNLIIWIVFGVLMWLFFAIYCLHLGYAIEHPKFNIYHKAPGLIENLSLAAENMTSHPFSCFPITSKALGYVGIMSLFYGMAALVIWTQAEQNKHDRAGEENGSAKWFRDWKWFKLNFVDPVGKKECNGRKNIIVADDIMMSYVGHETKRNINATVVGGSGTGKSTGIVIPNLLQHNTSYIVTDPSAENRDATAKAMLGFGYKVRMLNLNKMEESFNYNPFDYIEREDQTQKELDVAKMVETLMQNTEDPNANRGEKFWTDSMTALYTAIIHLLIDFKEPEEQNFATVLKYVQSGRVDGDKGTAEGSRLGKTFAECQEVEDKEIESGKRTTRSKAFTNFDTFKLAGSKTMQSILISASVRINKFSTDAVAKLTSTNYENDDMNIHLERVGTEPTVLYFILPTADKTFNFIVAMCYTQLFDITYRIAEQECPKRYHIVNNDGIFIESMFKTEKTASERLGELKKCVIEEVDFRERPKRDEEEEVLIEDKADKKMAGKYALRRMYAVKIPFEPVSDEHYAKMSVFEKRDYLKRKSEGGELIRQFSKMELAQEFYDDIQSATVYHNARDQRLPWPLRFMLDEFANVGRIPDFDERLATMRKFNVSCTIILQNLIKLDAIYKEEAKSIRGNCDLFIFLGSPDMETCKQVSEMLGDATNTTMNTSYSGGRNGTYGKNFSRSARKLLDPAELFKLPNHMCIVTVRGLDPMLRKKYKFMKHPYFHMTGNFDPENNSFDEDFAEIFFNRGIFGKGNDVKKDEGQIFEGRVIEEKDPQKVLFDYDCKSVFDFTAMLEAAPEIEEIAEKEKEDRDGADDYVRVSADNLKVDAASLMEFKDVEAKMMNMADEVMDHFMMG